jgi:hypothetical protein
MAYIYSNENGILLESEQKRTALVGMIAHLGILSVATLFAIGMYSNGAYAGFVVFAIIFVVVLWHFNRVFPTQIRTFRSESVNKTGVVCLKPIDKKGYRSGFIPAHDIEEIYLKEEGDVIGVELKTILGEKAQFLFSVHDRSELRFVNELIVDMRNVLDK